LIEPAHAAPNNVPGPAAAWAMTLLWLAGVGVATVHAGQTPVPSAVKLNPAPALAHAGAIPVRQSPFAAVASKARNTLLYDPVFSAQLAQPLSDGNPASPWSQWLNEDVAYIITDAERNAFNQLNTDAEREQFVEQFWLRRDPTPDTIENEFREEHYRRIAYANEHFSSRIPGWKTDRGRVYIKFGPPDEIDSHPAGQPFPFEDWRYRFINGAANVLIEFVDTAMTGEYHWTVDPTEKASLTSPAPSALLSAQQLQEIPPVKFKDLEAAMVAGLTGNILPMLVRVDYVRVTESSVMANITIQFENRDLQFQLKEGVQKATVNLLGRISTMTRRPVTTFEKPLEVNASPDGLQKFIQLRQIYQQAVPLVPGQYRLNIVARDTVSGNLNNYEVALDVPRFDDGTLASSSLVLADLIEKLPTRSLGGAMFSIGDARVRPRLGNKFISEEKMGIYLQLYNFGFDQATQKPSGSIEYEIDKAGSNEKVMDFSEDIGSIANASASQVTIEKMLPLRTFAPGAYTLRVTATDKSGNQTVQRQGNFTVSPD